MIRHALIMAAGRGLRMSPLTDAIPKPMAPFNGSTLIANGISLLVNRIDNIHITVGYKGAMLAQHVIEHGASSIFNTEGKGNCWWLFNTLLKDVDEPLYVLTCDNVVSLDFDRIEDDYEKLGCPPCMVVPVRPIDGLEGDFIFQEDGYVMRLTREEKTDTYCSGIQVLNPKRINDSIEPADNFDVVWDQLIAKRQLMTSSVYPDRWFAVDTIDQLAALNRSLA